MKDNQKSLHELFEQVPTQELDAILQTELQQNPIDADAVRMILRILRERECRIPVEIDEAAAQAWEQYLQETSIEQIPIWKRSWVLRAAAIAAVLCVIVLIGPLTANAERFHGMLTRLTDSIFEFFDPNDKKTNTVEYEFKTDNLGLQQVYDAVLALGVTDPVVPMWLPEGFELVEIKVTDNQKRIGVKSFFSNGEDTLIYQLWNNGNTDPRSYHKDASDVTIYEMNGVVHNFLKNRDSATVVWIYGTIECTIVSNCQEEVLQKIINSIYLREEK